MDRIGSWLYRFSVDCIYGTQNYRITRRNCRNSPRGIRDKRRLRLIVQGGNHAGQVLSDIENFDQTDAGCQDTAAIDGFIGGNSHHHRCVDSIWLCKDIVVEETGFTEIRHRLIWCGIVFVAQLKCRACGVLEKQKGKTVEKYKVCLILRSHCNSSLSRSLSCCPAKWCCCLGLSSPWAKRLSVSYSTIGRRHRS